VRTRQDNATIDARSELAVLALLLDPATPALWSLDELGRELGDALRATDAVARLAAAGLVHRSDGFAFVTRAAAHFSRLVGGV
jgi:hypothetical protein